MAFGFETGLKSKLRMRSGHGFVHESLPAVGRADLRYACAGSRSRACARAQTPPYQGYFITTWNGNSRKIDDALLVAVVKRNSVSLTSNMANGCWIATESDTTFNMNIHNKSTWLHSLGHC